MPVRAVVAELRLRERSPGDTGFSTRPATAMEIPRSTLHPAIQAMSARQGMHLYWWQDLSDTY